LLELDLSVVVKVLLAAMTILDSGNYVLSWLAKRYRTSGKQTGKNHRVTYILAKYDKHILLGILPLGWKLRVLMVVFPLSRSEIFSWEPTTSREPSSISVKCGTMLLGEIFDYLLQ